MDLRTVMDAHRVMQKHILIFAEEHNFKVHQAEISRIVNGRILPPARYKAIIKAALLSFGVSQAEVDAVSELQT